MIPLSEAAKRVGKTKQTLAKAVKSRRLPATKGADGVWRVDPEDLEQVYPVGQETIPTDTPEIVALRRENELLRGLLEREQARADRAEERFDSIFGQLTDLLAKDRR